MFGIYFGKTLIRVVRNGRRKGILDPKRLVGCVVDNIDIATAMCLPPHPTEPNQAA